jgi:hypothetical protein
VTAGNNYVTFPQKCFHFQILCPNSTPKLTLIITSLSYSACVCVCVCVCVGNGKPGIDTRLRLNFFTQPYTSLDFEIMDCKDNIMDQIPTEIHEKLVAGGYVDLAQLPHTDTNIARWDRVTADCGLSGDELTRLMMILCIPREIHDKLVAGGYVDLAQLPNTVTNMARWDIVQADCGLSGDELSQLMMILCIPSDIQGKLAKAGIVKCAHLPNTDTNMARWEFVEKRCGLNGGELTELMNILFPVGK